MRLVHPNRIVTNGELFKTDSQGFLANMMETMYNERVKFKQKEIKARQEYEKTKEKSLLKKVSRFHNIQWSRKIALNSAYGAIGNQFFRYYDVRQATAITTGGQYVIKFIENKMNDYLNHLLKTDDHDYIVASDTDSIYVCLDKLVEKICGNKSKDQVVEFLNKACEKQFEPYIDKCYKELAEYTNAFDQKMEMAREVIADKGIWVSKKRYMLNVYDSEGVRYAEPKMKIMGIEAVKSSTPAICRKRIKEAIDIIMKKEEPDLINFVDKFKNEFEGLPPEAIAFPRSCNNLKKYSDASNIFQKSCPIHVKGSLIYNHYLKQLKLTAKYPLIQEGDKIKFILLKEPNPFKYGVISYLTKLPREYKMQEYIDYTHQCEKTCL